MPAACLPAALAKGQFVETVDDEVLAELRVDIPTPDYSTHPVSASI